MASDFEKQRLEQEAARRDAAAARDVARRTALADGARAPSASDKTSGSQLARVGMFAAGALAVLCVPVAALSLGNPVFLGLSVLGGLVFAGAALAARRYASGRSALPVAHAAAPAWVHALRRAQAAVDGAGLDAAQAVETTEALRAGAAEIEELNRLRMGAGGTDLAARADARTAAFIGNCDAIVTALGGGSGPASSGALDVVASQLTTEAEARAELDQALRQASSLRQPSG